MNPQPTSDAAPAGSDTAHIERQVLAAQVGMVFDRSRSSNWVGPPVALLIAWLLWPVVDHRLLIGWVGLKVLAAVLRAAANGLHERDRADPDRVRRWGRLFCAVLVYDGATWGLIGTLLLPASDPVLEMMMMATVLGIAGAGLVVLSMSLAASLSLMVPMLLPVLLMQLAQGDRNGLYVGIGMAVFLGIIVVEGRRASAHTQAMLRLRYRMDDLAEQRRQALDLAQRSSDVKGRFMATMSHEMRTPLHGVLGLARLLREELALPDAAAAARRAERLQTLERTGEHLLGVINDVLDFSRLEGRPLRLAEQSFDLHALVSEAADMARQPASEHGLVLHLEQALPAPCAVIGDATRLRQVLINLLGNAVKFTPAGHVTLRSRMGAAGTQVIEVEDSGPGVPAADRERIFEPFEQLDGSFSRSHGGTGLGLAIARQLARAMGGDLSCQQAPGGGALFRLVLALPAGTALPESPITQGGAPALQHPHGAAKARVLLAEDNPVNAMVAQAWLEHMGLEVTTVPDGQSAVDEACSGRYDIVLMDCQMPRLDGFAATERIRDHERRHGPLRGARGALPIVALTANALPGDREHSLRAGMDAHLAKPFDEAELRRLLARFLAPAPASAVA